MQSDRKAGFGCCGCTLALLFFLLQHGAKSLLFIGEPLSLLALLRCQKHVWCGGRFA